MVRKNIRDKLEVSEKQVQSIIREANQEIEGLQEKVNGKMNFYLQLYLESKNWSAENIKK
jgi:hypothetical protein